MKCPLQGFEESKWGGIEKVEAVDCLKEECAWWHTYQDSNKTTHAACAIIHIADRKEIVE